MFHGFWPNPVNTLLIARRHQPMFRAVALTAGSDLAIAGVSVEALERGGAIVVHVENRGLATPDAPLHVSLSGASEGVVVGTQYTTMHGPSFGAATSSDPMVFTFAPTSTAARVRLEITVTSAEQTLVMPVVIDVR